MKSERLKRRMKNVTLNNVVNLLHYYLPEEAIAVLILCISNQAVLYLFYAEFTAKFHC